MDTLKRSVLNQVLTLALIAAVLWCVELTKPLVGAVLSGSWEAFGIRPRTWHGLIGIIAAPLVHVDHTHLMRNLGPLLFLGWLVMLEGMRTFWKVTLGIAVLGGAAVWLLGFSHSNYLGSSGVAHGYLGYAMMRAVVSRRLEWIVCGGVALLYYGGMLYSWFGWHEGVSLLGHVAGFIAGMLMSWIMHRPRGLLH
jgi:membrane associated rhomboid family serine protease